MLFHCVNKFTVNEQLLDAVMQMEENKGTHIV